MKLRRVISGGQTGADRTGLECAKALGLETGGTVPKGWRTDDGPDPSLAEFGCVESNSSAYPPRTEQNVLDSEVTLWFGTLFSPGYKLTKRLCLKHDRYFIENPTAFIHIQNTWAVINIAGNRKRINPRVVARVRAFFSTLK